MKKDLREIYLAPSRALAKVAIDVFAEKFQAEHHKAVECLTKDREALLANGHGPMEARAPVTGKSRQDIGCG